MHDTVRTLVFSVNSTLDLHSTFQRLPWLFQKSDFTRMRLSDRNSFLTIRWTFRSSLPLNLQTQRILEFLAKRASEISIKYNRNFLVDIKRRGKDLKTTIMEISFSHCFDFSALVFFRKIKDFKELSKIYSEDFSDDFPNFQNFSNDRAINSRSGSIVFREGCCEYSNLTSIIRVKVLSKRPHLQFGIRARAWTRWQLAANLPVKCVIRSWR